MATRFIPNQSGIDNLPLQSDVKNDMRERAERALAQAKATAPVLTGQYAGSLYIEEMPDGSFRIAGGTGYDIYVEADTGNLARSLDSA